MNDPERPPLDPLEKEQLDQALHQIDLAHWPAIAEMRGRRYYPLDQPQLPRTPHHLQSHIRFYATKLFKTEAKRYERFSADEQYHQWLALVADRVLARVKDAIGKLEDGDPLTLILGYHGLNWLEVETDLKAALNVLVKKYGGGILSESETNFPAPTPEGDDDTEPGNRERIDAFIRKLAASGLKINRKAIWQAAGYSDRTEFERFQRGESRNQTASMNFNRILSLKADAFRELLKRES